MHLMNGKIKMWEPGRLRLNSLEQFRRIAYVTRMSISCSP
jgi:hypothetical protein